MRFIITGRNIDVTEGLRSAVEEKLGKLDRFFAPETEVHVTLSVEKERQKIEVTIPVKGNIIRSEQVSTRITHLSLAVKMGKATLRKYNGVIGFVGYGSIQCILLGRRSRYRILLQRIGRKPLSPLQGDSHLQTIPYLQRVCPLNIRRRDLRSTALRSSPTREKKQDE